MLRIDLSVRVLEIENTVQCSLHIQRILTQLSFPLLRFLSPYIGSDHSLHGGEKASLSL